MGQKSNTSGKSELEFDVKQTRDFNEHIQTSKAESHDTQENLTEMA